MSSVTSDKTIAGALKELTKKFEACQASDYFENGSTKMLDCWKHAGTNLMFTDSGASVMIYALTFLLALSMIFLGRCYKKSLYFAIGALPAFFLASNYKSNANAWLSTNEEDKSWFSANFETVFLWFSIFLAIIAGCLAIKFNRFALACIGGVLMGCIGKSLGFQYLLSPYLEFNGTFSAGAANIFSQIIFIVLGALIFCYCFAKVFRNVVPLIGGVFAADSLLAILVWVSAKFNLIWLQQKIFKPTSLLIMRGVTRWGDSEKKSLKETYAKLDENAKEMLKKISGENPLKLWDGVEAGFFSNWPIWTLWLLIAISLYCVGHSRMKKDELREEIEEEREQYHGKRTRGANYV